MLNENQMIHLGRSGDDRDAVPDAALAAADEDMLSAISNRLDLDVGLARVIRDLGGSSATRAESQPPACAGEGRRILDASIYQDRSSRIYTKDPDAASPAPVGPILPVRDEPADLIRAINASNEAEEQFPRARQTADTDAALRAHATDTIMRLLQEHPAVAKEINETLRTRVHLQELTRRTRQAEDIQADTEQRESSLAAKLDPAGHRILRFGLGAVIIAVLVVLDTFSLNWAAQAFGLDSAATWLVTFVLVAASIGAMLSFEFTRSHPRRRGILAAMVAAAYLALLGLRTEFLTTVASGSFLAAFFQSALLTAIPAGLVWCGAAVLARTRFPNHSRARASARRAAQAADDARAAQLQATEKLQRHVGGLYQMLLPWALRSAPFPEGVDHAKSAAELEQAIRALFTMT
jgi:hypothetical protein